MAFKNPLVDSLVFQAPRTFAGQLNVNEVFSSVYNMLIGQRILQDERTTKYTSLVDRFRTEGSKYGDTLLFYAVRNLGSYAWAGDNDLNVLQTHRPKNPECQSVVINQFRQIALTVDSYLSPRAFSDEGTFGRFQAEVVDAMMAHKRDFEAKLMNVFVGTVKPANQAVKDVSVTFVTGATSAADKEAERRMNAAAVAKALVDLEDDMADSSTKYNDYANYAAYGKDEMLVVYNTKYRNEINFEGTPTIYHSEDLKINAEDSLLPKYFGNDIDATRLAAISASTPTTKKPIDSDDSTYQPQSGNEVVIRSKYYCEITVGGTTYVVNSGDEIPVGATVGSGKDFELTEIYEEDPTIICKLVHKDAIPFMSGFAVGSEFWNAKALNTNKYYTWGYSELTYLKDKPIVAIKKA